jgi:hypothetical protein
MPLIERHGKEVVFSGTATESLMALMKGADIHPADSHVRQPDAVWVARLSETETPGAPPKPLYLRPPDAKLPENPL